jgi:hypoxanthine phosphoribosyltransferase
MNAPEGYNRLATKEQVDETIQSIATQIIEDFPNTTPLFVALLRGAAPFSSKLMLSITQQSPRYHPELDYMMVSTYGDGRTAGEPHIVTDLAPTTIVHDRNVVMIDDVLDKGVTADFVFKHMRARGAAGLRLAVLCDKHTEREYDIAGDYVGFTFDDNWLVGMGMDDSQAAIEGYRWIDEIWEVDRSGHVAAAEDDKCEGE